MYKGGRQALFWQVLDLGASIDLQFLKRSEVLKPLIVQTFQFLKFIDSKMRQTGGQQPRPWKRLCIFCFAINFQRYKRRKFLQTPSHPTLIEFVTSADRNFLQVGRQSPFRKRLNFWTI
ncbi:hypothetical protein I3842_14G009600 [Carya illinoinensis]|uniref:Uncharacterized protein n=1 Tax=Carya illinoinensis TaxID=32201 RepID=A0A922ADW1_CARIL|nr:hypothetical protein I3842_14G009600 [Carya illinoinensis]